MGTPYEDMARDAMDKKRVVVFCDSDADVKLCKNGIAAAAKRLGARKVVYPLRDRRLDVDGNPICIFGAGGFSYRGFDADVVYLSESARRQFDFASVAGAIVK